MMGAASSCIDVTAATANPTPQRADPLLPDIEAAIGSDVRAFDRLVCPPSSDLSDRAGDPWWEPTLAMQVQEAWLAAWRQLATLRDAARFDAWLDQILVDACRMSLRGEAACARPGCRRASKRRLAGTPDQIAERDALDRAFGRLTVEQRASLLRRLVRPLSMMAAALRRPRRAGEVRELHAARAALDRRLERRRWTNVGGRPTGRSLMFSAGDQRIAGARRAGGGSHEDPRPRRRAPSPVAPAAPDPAGVGDLGCSRPPPLLLVSGSLSPGSSLIRLPFPWSRLCLNRQVIAGRHGITRSATFPSPSQSATAPSADPMPCSGSGRRLNADRVGGVRPAAV